MDKSELPMTTFNYCLTNTMQSLTTNNDIPSLFGACTLKYLQNQSTINCICVSGTGRPVEGNMKDQHPAVD